MPGLQAFNSEDIVVCVVCVVCALERRHYPRSPAQARLVRAGHSGPRSGALPDGFRIQVEADRVGVGARGEQVESRGWGVVSCGESGLDDDDG